MKFKPVIKGLRNNFQASEIERTEVINEIVKFFEMQLASWKF